MSRGQKEWVDKIIDGININSKIFNPKLFKKGNRKEEDKFLNDVKYQYIVKNEEAKRKFRIQKEAGLNEEINRDPKHRSKAAFLMLYKKGLTSLQKDTLEEER
jgi:hypothetical protein